MLSERLNTGGDYMNKKRRDTITYSIGLIEKASQLLETAKDEESDAMDASASSNNVNVLDDALASLEEAIDNLGKERGCKCLINYKRTVL